MRHDCSHRRLGFTLVVLLAFLSQGTVICFAQPISDASEEAQSRDRLFEELEQDVQFLVRQGSLLKKVVRLVKPSVVHIEAEKNDVNSGGLKLSKTLEEAGSGVIILIGEKQYILTNRHVIYNSSLQKIRIKLSDGRLFHPDQIWADHGTDIAVMSLTANGLTAARIGDSSKIEIGDFVLAVGSPFGLSHSVTFGIISAKGRRDLHLGDDAVRFQDFMQTDAAINPGNSGGPLLNLLGEVIGINTAIATNSGGSEGIGFTIPINMAMIVARQLIEHGRVVRAYLGVHLDSKFSPQEAARIGLALPQGARVSGITPNSPAEAAELQAGDVILSFDKTLIEDDSHLVNRVSLTPVGKVVEVIVFRQGASKSITVKVGERGKFETVQ